MTTATALIVVGILIVVAAAAWYFNLQRRSTRLQTRFGPEYDRAMQEYGTKTKAEDALVARERRREKLHIESLTPGQRERFGEQWHNVQSHFVDDPAGSIREADQLVADVMKTRGYPMAEFDHRAEDLSVDYPHVVRNYRQAHDIALRHEQGQATTEDLRRAMVCYRELFDELLESRVKEAREVREVQEVKR
jgi:hypothetical protein